MQEVDFRTALNEIVGKRCWGIIAGRGTGSTISLDYGGRRRLAPPLTNPYVSSEQREYAGEYILFIECAWRLEIEERVVCSSQDFSDEGAPPPQLQMLVNRTVSSVEVAPSARDLALHHTPDATLRVFNDASLVHSHDAFSLFTPTAIAIVTAGGGIKRNRRSE